MCASCANIFVCACERRRYFITHPMGLHANITCILAVLCYVAARWVAGFETAAPTLFFCWMVALWVQHMRGTVPLAEKIAENRGLIVLFIACPLSIVFDTCLQLVLWATKTLCAKRARDGHKERVAQVTTQLKKYAQEGSKKRLVTDRPSWLGLSTRFFKKSGFERVKISHLTNVLGFHPATRPPKNDGKPYQSLADCLHETPHIVVEPLVSTGQATQYLKQYHHALEVCLEVAEATLGGLVRP